MAISGLSYVDSSSSSTWRWGFETGDTYPMQWHEQWPQAEVHVHTLYLEKKEVKEEMRGLFYVAIVDYLNDTVLEDGLYIAKDAETARIKALSVFADTYDLDDLDVVCQRLGDIRKKKEIQEVKVVKE